MVAKSFPILFVAPGDVSEAVLSSGLLKKLHDEAPNPSFTIVANAKVAPLYADMPKVERLVVTERKPSARRWFGVLGPLRARRWALVIDLPAGVTTGRLRPKGKALKRSGDEPAHKLIEAARLMRLEDDPPAVSLHQRGHRGPRRGIDRRQGTDPGAGAGGRVGGQGLAIGAAGGSGAAAAGARRADGGRAPDDPGRWA